MYSVTMMDCMIIFTRLKPALTVASNLVYIFCLASRGMVIGAVSSTVPLPSGQSAATRELATAWFIVDS